jgi:hypothetical protein
MQYISYEKNMGENTACHMANKSLGTDNVNAGFISLHQSSKLRLLKNPPE